MTTPEQRGGLGESRSAVSAAWIGRPSAAAPPGASGAGGVGGGGAGAGMDPPFLVGFARGMAEGGVATARFNFHYANSGRRSPDPEPSLRAAWVEAFGGGRAMAGGLPMLAGGKSLGGGP